MVQRGADGVPLVLGPPRPIPQDQLHQARGPDPREALVLYETRVSASDDSDACQAPTLVDERDEQVEDVVEEAVDSGEEEGEQVQQVVEGIQAGCREPVAAPVSVREAASFKDRTA